MNVLYCGDKNIEKGLTISILSLLKNVSEEINIYVLTINFEKPKIQGITDDSIKILDDRVNNNNKDSFVKKIDITELFEKEMPLSNMKTHFTPCCMLRLFANKIDSLPDKILYLDTDVIARKNPHEFYKQNIEDYEFVRSIRLLWKMVLSKKSI